jgi:hypothetical protein
LPGKQLDELTAAKNIKENAHKTGAKRPPLGEPTLGLATSPK